MGNSDITFDGNVVRKRYLRTDRCQPEREWSALVLLEEQAPMLAPRPIAQATEPSATVMSRVSGAPLDEVLTREQTSALVTAYRSLYAVTLPASLPLRFADPAAFIADTVEWLGETRRVSSPNLVVHALDSAAEWFDTASPGLTEIHDPVLAQGDGNVANMLWDGGRLCLVDFEYAGVGDLAFEVADLVEHASSRLRGLLDPDAVIAGFELTGAQSARVDAYRIVLATFWLLMLLPGGPGHDINPAGSAESQARHLLSHLAGGILG